MFRKSIAIIQVNISMVVIIHNLSYVLVSTIMMQWCQVRVCDVSVWCLVWWISLITLSPHSVLSYACLQQNKGKRLHHMWSKSSSNLLTPSKSISSSHCALIGLFLTKCIFILTGRFKSPQVTHICQYYRVI